jgi:hypothetical protein
MSCSKQSTSTNAPGTANPTGNLPRNSVDVVKATAQPVEIKRNESGDAIVEVKIDSGYHINANPPTFPYLKATALELAPSPGISVNFIVYPDAITKRFAFEEKPLAVYEGTTKIKVNLKADKSAPTRTQNLSGKLSVQACDDHVCYAPGTLDVSIPLSIK